MLIDSNHGIYRECNPDSRLQWRAVSQRSHRRNQLKCRSNRTLRVVLARLRIAKINYGGVAVRVSDESVVPTGDLSDAPVIALDDFA